MVVYNKYNLGGNMRKETLSKILVFGIIFLFFVVGFQQAFANDNNISVGKAEQKPQRETFYRTFGEREDDKGWWVQQTIDGGYIILGDTAKYSDPDYKTDVWLIKTDSTGNKMWDKTYGGIIDRDRGYCVQQTYDNGYIITGYKDTFELWLFKTDSSGNMEWDKTYGGADTDGGICVQQTTDGGYIIAGYKDSIGGVGGNVWLIKTYSNGTIEWDKTYGGADTDYAHYIQQTTDDGYIIIGTTCSYGNGEEDIWVIKTDNNGNMEWDKTFGGTEFDFGHCVQQTTNGGYIIVGKTRSYGVGNYDAWLIKTDNNGIKVWDKTYGGIEGDWSNCGRQTTDDGYILTGLTDSFGAGGRDVWLIKTDSNGNMEWDKTFGGLGYDWSNCVQQTTDGGYIITGEKDHDVWLIKTNSVGTKEWDKTFDKKSKATNSPIWLGLLERFPLIQKLTAYFLERIQIWM
jgi:hypothetical protein